MLTSHRKETTPTRRYINLVPISITYGNIRSHSLYLRQNLPKYHLNILVFNRGVLETMTSQATIMSLGSGASLPRGSLTCVLTNYKYEKCTLLCFVCFWISNRILYDQHLKTFCNHNQHVTYSSTLRLKVKIKCFEYILKINHWYTARSWISLLFFPLRFENRISI